MKVSLLVCALIALSAACAHTLDAPVEPGATEPTPAAASEPVPDEVEVRVLVIAFRGAKDASAEQTRTEAEARERAQLLTDMVRSGASFAELVGSYSDRQGAADDHGLTRVRRTSTDGFEQTVARAAATLPVGKVSDPIASEHGFVVIERLRVTPQQLTRIAAKHILILYVGSPQTVPGATHTQAEARALAEDIAKQAAAPDADWDALAAQYTEEPGGKQRHGDLGSFGRGQMVPAFENAAFSLSVGEVSGVVESPFGFHVIKRTQ